MANKFRNEFISWETLGKLHFLTKYWRLAFFWYLSARRHCRSFAAYWKSIQSHQDIEYARISYKPPWICHWQHSIRHFVEGLGSMWIAKINTADRQLKVISSLCVKLRVFSLTEKVFLDIASNCCKGRDSPEENLWFDEKLQSAMCLWRRLRSVPIFALCESIINNECFHAHVKLEVDFEHI